MMKTYCPRQFTNATRFLAYFLLIQVTTAEVGLFDEDAQRNIKASSTPVVVKIDTPNCRQCGVIDSFWDAAGVAFGPTLIWRGSCVDTPSLCSARPYIPPNMAEGSPVFESWTGTHFVPYTGEKDLMELKDWILQVVSGSGSVTNQASATAAVGVNGQATLETPERTPDFLPRDAPRLMNELRMTALHAAAFGGDVGFVREFLRQIPSQVNTRNRNGATALALAAQAGHWEIIQVLLDEFGADMEIPDAQLATPLRAATILGKEEVVVNLLERGASIEKATTNAFSLADVARGEGHGAIAAILEEKESDAFHQLQQYLRNSSELPEGVSIIKCNLPARFETVRCRLAGCTEMPTKDAMEISCSDGPCAFSPLGKMINQIVSTLADMNEPTWKLKQAHYFHTTKHLPPGTKCFPGDPRCTLFANWASGCDKNEDVWECLFGQGEASGPRSECKCDELEETSRRELEIILHAALLLEGDRKSPHLPKGPTLPPFEYEDGGIAVSVHVRGGDSCDVVNYSANQTSWALWPFQWEGVRGTDWNAVRRFCVHPSVHLATVRGLMQTYKVKSVLLATDSTEAVELFRKELPDDVELHLNEYDRSPLDHRGAGLNPIDHWIEYRSSRDPDFAAHAMHTAVEDVRLLARGHLLVDTMCSNFAHILHAVMVAHNGRDIPVVSLDTCQVICDESALQYDDGCDFQQ